MGVVDKLKKILFDEEDVEIPVNSGELPEKELRIVADKDEKKVSSRSLKKEIEPTREFKNYHDFDEEDTIVELKIPQDDEEEEEKTSVPERRIKFPIDDFDDIEEDYAPSRTIREEESTRTLDKIETSRVSKYVGDIVSEPKKEPREEKNYRKIIHDLDEENKKPFEVTPIISPVFGVLNKNYKQEELAEKKVLITQANSGVKPRLYGPVSYNDAPLPKPPVFEAKKTNLKEELVELNSTISDLISDGNEVDESDIEIPAKIAHNHDMLETIDIPKIINSRIEDDEDDDLIIETENYDEITSSIENPVKEHTSIEDAFEPTSEFDQITDYDREVEKRSIEEEIDEDELIEDEPETFEEDFETSYKIEDDEEIVETKDEEDDRLTDTIETDLFNLIDSMYKDDEEDEDSEDE